MYQFNNVLLMSLNRQFIDGILAWINDTGNLSRAYTLSSFVAHHIEEVMPPLGVFSHPISWQQQPLIPAQGYSLT